VYTSRAAAAAPNPDAPPLYFDLPFRLEGGEGQTDLAVTRRIIGRDAMHDAQAFEAGPEALRGMLIYHGASDNDVPVAVARGFDALLTDLGIEHEYLEVAGGHCDLDYAPVLEFMSERLAFD
jgi:hypothetical protein